MKWIDYVNATADGATQSAIGYKIGVSAATISRWATFAPRPENVAAFARAYGRPVLEAFIAAGFLTTSEANERPEGRPKLSALSNDELVQEIGRRLKGVDNATEITHIGDRRKTSEPARSIEDLEHDAAAAREIKDDEQ